MAEPTEPRWLALARRELGTREAAGRRSSPTIASYFADAGHPAIRDDAVAWCAAFVGACLARSGLRPTGSLMARSYLEWGVRLPALRVGAIAVLSRGRDRRFGHVGFVTGWTRSEIRLLGGNQSDQVSVASYPRKRLLDLRWPETARDRAQPNERAAFDVALAHVLKMEGGFANDPADPGGPTQQGITLATYAAHLGVRLTTSNKARLVAELRRLGPDAIAKIYRDRYWLAARCDQLPPGLSLMHFDAAVLHGPSRAARFLQQALAVEVDGEIGPGTLAAAAARPVEATLRRYSDLRIARLKSSKSFQRFGRGWTERLKQTLATALADDHQGRSTYPAANKEPEKMPEMPAQRKWWGKSVTIWGAAITALSTVLPVVGPLVGLDITAEVVRGLGEQLTVLVQAAGGVIGTALTIVGRVRAKSVLVQRQVSFQV